MARSDTTRKDIYAEVTNTIIEALEAGTVPWHRPWNAATGLPMSMSSRRAYRGVNVFLLEMTARAKGFSSPWWGTYKQIADHGGQVRKGEKSTMVVFWKRLTVSTTAEEKARTGKDEKAIPMLRYFQVFNADQADGLPERFSAGADQGDGFDPVAEAEAILTGYAAAPSVHHGGSQAFYRPGTDSIHMPDREAFESGDAYYSTLFHEMTHSTGHTSRLARPTLLESHAFGDESYSKEELVAEMGAAMLSGMAGIHQATIPASAAYVASWLRVLKGDPKMVVQAAGQAQRAADHILGATFEEKGDDALA
jgi:antirestriction protein ArdC